MEDTLPAATRGAARGARARQSALWAAYGDALGFISELTDAAGLRHRTSGRDLTQPLEWKRRIGGRGGINATLPAGCYSDDTQLRIATARAIGRAGFDVEAFAKVELPVWPAYALGGGRSTKAAAANLGKTTTAWFSNTYQGWLNAGGNGAVMRIQPHVWSARDLNEPEGYVLDVFRNSVCTHGHPTALMGAVLHALTLAHSMTTGTLPDPVILAKLIDDAGIVPSMLRNDPQVGELWLTGWEREAHQLFSDAWRAECQDAAESVTAAERALANGSPADRYARVIDVLNLLDPARRGSGILTVIAATALTWCDERPAESLSIAANAIGTDTDTIATMAGALLGAVTTEDPPVPVLDHDLISAEAERMTQLADGGGRNGHRYPDLLTWSAPQTQADALLSSRDGLHVAGLGKIRRTLGEPMPARQGSFQWQWAELALGQTILIKCRGELPILHDPQAAGEDTKRSLSRRTEGPEMPVTPDTRQPESRRWRDDRSEPGRRDPQEASVSGHDRRKGPLDLDKVIAFVEREQDNDESIGYAVRRVANEATPQQMAAFLAVLLQILRRPTGDR